MNFTYEEVLQMQIAMKEKQEIYESRRDRIKIEHYKHDLKEYNDRIEYWDIQAKACESAYNKLHGLAVSLL